MTNTAHNARRACDCDKCQGAPAWMTPAERAAWRWEQAMTEADRQERRAFAAMGV